ncbi:MAG: hypothetical protein QM530_08210 [Phycisphaerales bacterium]|nr:hypothetical protein [Phycisphaerales bacterium]
MKNYKTIYIIALLFYCSTQSVYGQNQNKLLDKIKVANQSKEISYEYKMILRNMLKAKNVDSASGKLYTLSGQYVDSSNYQFVARIANYFCRFDHKNKTATICDVSLLSKKSRIKFNADDSKITFNMTDSLLKMLNSNYEIDSSSKYYYRLKVRIKNYPINYLQYDFHKKSYKLMSAYYEIEDHSDEQFYITKFYINNINYTVNQSLFDLSRLFTIANDKPTLKPKYAKYKLTPIEL